MIINTIIFIAIIPKFTGASLTFTSLSSMEDDSLSEAETSNGFVVSIFSMGFLKVRNSSQAVSNIISCFCDGIMRQQLTLSVKSRLIQVSSSLIRRYKKRYLRLLLFVAKVRICLEIFSNCSLEYRFPFVSSTVTMARVSSSLTFMFRNIPGVFNIIGLKSF